MFRHPALKANQRPTQIVNESQPKPDDVKEDCDKSAEDEMTRIEKLEKMVKNLDSVTQQLIKENNELKSFKEYHETSYIHYFYSKLTGLWS